MFYTCIRSINIYHPFKTNHKFESNLDLHFFVLLCFVLIIINNIIIIMNNNNIINNINIIINNNNIIIIIIIISSIISSIIIIIIIISIIINNNKNNNKDLNITKPPFIYKYKTHLNRMMISYNMYIRVYIQCMTLLFK